MADLKQPGVWGIDMGQCALKAIRLEVIEGQVTATAFDYVEHPKILNQPDADPDALTREALEKFLSRNNLRGDQVAIGVAGQNGLARFVKLPPVEEKKIPDIVRFEAKQQIPFPLDEVVWDFQKIGTGAVTDGFAMETEIGLFALKRDTVNRSLQHFRDVNVEVHIVQMTPLALCNFLSYDLLQKDNAPKPPPPQAAEGEEGGGAEEEEEPARDGNQKRCVVALDIGTDNSNLVVTDGEKIIWQRPIPFGGNHFTRALSKDLKLTFAKAEHLKRNATKSPDLKKILAALKPVLNDFVGEVQRSLGYFTNTHRNAQIEYMVGLGNAFRLPGLQKFLSEKLQLDVRKLQKLERLSGDNVINAPSFTQNVLSFATAYGLALQAMNYTRLRTNMLPQEIQFERMIRAKKPWAVSAAAALLMGVLATTVQYALQMRAVAADSVVTAIAKGKTITDKNTSEKTAFSSRETAVKAKEDSVRNIISGTEERANWLMINEYLNACLPAPGYRLDGKVKSSSGDQIVVTDRDGKDHTFNINQIWINGAPVDGKQKPGDRAIVIYNQLDEKAQKYWGGPAASSFVKFSERMAAGRNSETRAEDEGVKNLIQVNIESVFPLFTTDPKGYYNNLKQSPTDLAGMPLKDRNNPPDAKAGWVIELRGYTYHDNAYDFLLDTIVNTLAIKAVKEEAGKDKNAPTPVKDKGPAAETKATPPKAAAPDKGTPPKDAPAPKGATKGEGKQQPAADKVEIPPKLDPKAEREALWEKVITNKISHVCLFQYQVNKNIIDPENTSFSGSSVVNMLIPSGTSAAAPSGAQAASGQPKNAGGGGGSSWTPLTSGGGLGSGGGGEGRGFSGNRGGPPAGKGGVSMGAGPGGARPSGPPIGAGPGGQLPGPSKPPGAGGPTFPESEEGVKKEKTTRTDFIILLFWKEPTPSDERIKK